MMMMDLEGGPMWGVPEPWLQLRMHACEGGNMWIGELAATDTTSDDIAPLLVLRTRKHWLNGDVCCDG